MAALYHHSILSPGQWGINLEEQDQLLHPNWATVTDGLVLSESNLLSARGSISITTTAPASAELLRLFNYITAAGTETVISTTATKILSGVGDLTAAGNDITDTTPAPTNGFWKFLNFNGKVVGWQASHTPIVWAGSGDFAQIVAASGTLPDGDVAHAAFGRVWAVDDDKQTVRFCALLDETRWDAADGGGSIDMRNVWSQGMDYVTAISSIGSNLVIFGRKHIVVYTDGAGSPLGVDPTQMYVVDTIEGTGCVSRDSVVQVGEGDLLFLSEVGVQSLKRVIQSKDNPIVTISWQIAARIASAVKTELAAQASPATDVRGFTGLYVATTGQYLLIHNNGSIEDVYVFHTESNTVDEKGREVVPITIWDTSVLTNFRAAIQLRGGTIYFIGGANNHINTYNPDGTLDNSFSGITGDYESGWMTWSDPSVEPLLKFLKFAQITVSNSAELASALTFKYATDFEPTLDELTAAEAEGNPIRNIYDTTGDVEGQYFKIGLETNRFGGLSVEKVSMHMKIGRPAFVHNRDGQADPTIVTPSENLQLLVALNSNGTGGANLQRVATSMDGVTWTMRSAASVAAWNDLCYSPDLKLLVAVADNAIMTSPDGITWTSRTSPGNGGWASVCWSSPLGKFIAVGDLLSTQRVMTSTDGITWTLVTTPASADNTWNSVIWCDFLRAFIAGCANTVTDAVMTSIDGVTWVSRVTPTQSTDGLACSDSLLVATSFNGNTLYSLDGITWTLNTEIAAGQTNPAYSPTLDLFVTADNANAWSAPNQAPIDWTVRSIDDGNYECLRWSAVLAKFIAMNNGTNNDAVYASSNGTTWASLGTMPTADTWLKVIETEEV